MRGRFLLISLALLCAGLLAACGSSSTVSSQSSAGQSSAGQSSAGHSSSGGSRSACSSTAADAGIDSAATGPKIGYEGVPLEYGPPLAPACTTGSGPIDGISCAPLEQLAYHIHAHLAVFDNGVLYQLPAGVGIPGAQDQQTQYGPIVGTGNCFYWLHTHTTDGVIHIESPTKRIYPLGDFFDEWHQPLSSDRVASLHGAITALVNGKLWKKSPRDIPLLPHEDIQLEIGQPVPPIVMIDWARTGL